MPVILHAHSGPIRLRLASSHSCPFLTPLRAQIEESRPVSSQTARPLLGGGVSGAARGSVFVRMVNVGRESSAPPPVIKGGQGKAVRPLTEEAGVMQVTYTRFDHRFDHSAAQIIPDS